MNVTKRMPVPIYSVTCPECQSEIEYTAAEVQLCNITCPVCGIRIWASTIHPVRMEKGE